MEEMENEPSFVESPVEPLRFKVSTMVFDALEEMYFAGRHTDVQIIVQDKSFRCHKIVLASVSEYFDAMFLSGMRECYDGVVRLQGIESSTFVDILDFVYSGKLNICTENAEDLLRASALFQIKLLHQKCEEFLIGHISIENCIGAWRLAKAHECKELAKKAWYVILENFTDVCKTEDFNFLDADEMYEIINDDDLQVTNEEIVCDSVFRWYRFDPENRMEHTSKLFEHLRLPLLSSEYLLNEVEPMELVVNNQKCRDIVREAISYQMLPSRRPDFNSPRVTFRRYANMEEVLVVIGGYNASNERVADVLAYSFARKTWFQLMSLPWKLGREFSACVFGNDIFVSGGSQKLDSLLQFRSDNNEWVRCPNMIQGRRRHAMVAVGESLFVLGGYDDNQTEESNRTLNDIGEYAITSRTWSKCGELNTPVRSTTAAVSKEKIFIFGGLLADEKETNIVQCFDTRLKTCTRVDNLPYACKLSRAVVCDKRVFIVCTDGNVLGLTEDGVCKPVARIRHFNRRRFGAIHHKGNILLMGGECGTSVFRDIFTFNPDTEKSCTIARKNVPSRANFAGLKLILHKKFLKYEIKFDSGKISNQTVHTS
ncbi:kelch-like protein 6 isoform X1 [Mercenaria mercenaria]|uniref:kelch-like protein 6 isoform X1 n=2 Tax=Mercenaria mercenaria TaxID=6596 RepID=UPI00234FA1C1|nr:kelch-like protein 6 isoform X1 [Mercenaria mercenaria]